MDIMDKPDSTPASKPAQPKQKPSRNRIVDAYSTHWEGPRPGIITKAGDDGRCNVTVVPDVDLDKPMAFRAIRDVEIFDGPPAKTPLEAWCQWPPRV